VEGEIASSQSFDFAAKQRLRSRESTCTAFRTSAPRNDTTDLMTLVIYNSLIMTKKYRKERQLTPAWLDTLIGWLEVLAAIGAVVGAIYALVSLFKMLGT
jgi:hypothetical protein